MTKEHLRVTTVCGNYIIIDKEDKHLIEGRSVSLVVNSLYGMVTTDKGKREYVHRLVMGSPKNKQVDHINMDTRDNRKSNLRVATVSQNRANQGKSKFSKESTSKYKGVCFDKISNNWICRVRNENEVVYYKRFLNEESAALAYNHYARLIFGEYARLNDVSNIPSSVIWEDNIAKRKTLSGYRYISKTPYSRYEININLVDGTKIRSCKNNISEAVLFANATILEEGLHLLPKKKRILQLLKPSDVACLTEKQLEMYNNQLEEMESHTL